MPTAIIRANKCGKTAIIRANKCSHAVPLRPKMDGKRTAFK